MNHTPHTILGVEGTLVQEKPSKRLQCWKSEVRRNARVIISFDDKCRNGHNTFSFALEVHVDNDPTRCESTRNPQLIKRLFPELAHLLHWHLMRSDGPLHYLDNTIYLAGDRDYNHLRKGETKPLLAADGIPHWRLEGEEVVWDFKGFAPPPPPVLTWVQQFILGEGKDRELKSARACAKWPDATDEELKSEPEILRGKLEARLPDLIKAFKSDIEAIGFTWDLK